jgi:hypothetical protein
VSDEVRQRVGGTSEYDTLFAGLARRNMRLAKTLESNPALQRVVQKIVQGAEMHARIHNIPIEQARVDAVLTPAGKIVVSIHPPQPEARWHITVTNPTFGRRWFIATESQSFKAVDGPAIPVPSLKVGDRLLWAHGTVGTILDVQRVPDDL